MTPVWRFAVVFLAVFPAIAAGPPRLELPQYGPQRTTDVYREFVAELVRVERGEIARIARVRTEVGLLSFDTRPDPGGYGIWFVSRGSSGMRYSDGERLLALARVVDERPYANHEEFALPGFAELRFLLLPRDLVFLVFGRESALIREQVRYVCLVRSPPTGEDQVETALRFLDPLRGRDALVAAVASPNQRERLYAVRALGAPDLSPDYAVPPLLRALRDRSATVRKGAIASLGGLGIDGVDALPALEGVAREDRVDAVRDLASVAVRKVLGEVPVDYEAIQARAIVEKKVAAFRQIEAELKRHRKVLGKIPFDLADERVRRLTLWRFSETNPIRALPYLLLEHREDEDSFRRLCRFFPEGRVDPQSMEALPDLIELLGDRSLRSVAALVIAALGSEAGAAVPKLIDMLEVPYPEHFWCWMCTQSMRDRWIEAKIAACRALGSIGPAARGAVPALNAAIDEISRIDDPEDLWVKLNDAKLRSAVSDAEDALRRVKGGSTSGFRRE